MGAALDTRTDITPVALPPTLSMEPIDAGALSAWMERWFAKHLADAQAGAPGAAVAVVQGDRVLLTRGIGL
jgi:hypothetical protein